MKKHWWQHEAAIAWALILFFPLGIFMMWRYAPWRNRFKWLWTTLAAIVVLIIVAGIVGGSETQGGGGQGLRGSTPSAAASNVGHHTEDSAPQEASPSATPRPKISFTNDNWALALSNADQYKGSPVVLMGKVFTEPEITGGLTCFQMWTDPENVAGNTGVCVAGQPQEITEDSYVRVTGEIVEELSGQNAFGGTVTMPGILATAVQTVTRSDVVAPAVVIVDAGSTRTQHGLTITLDKVEIAKTETRVWVTVRNGSAEKAWAYDSGALLVQGSRQFERKFTFDSDLPELPDAVLPGIEASGVIVFEAIDPSLKQARLVWDGPHTEDYFLDFADWIWDFSW